MRGLRREPQRQPPVVSDGGRARARLERAGRQPLADDAPRHDHVAAVEQRLVALHRVAHADVGARFGEEQRVACERQLGVDRGRKRVVIHDDELSGVDAVCSRPRDNDGNDVTDEADDPVCQEGPPHPLIETRERRRLERAQTHVRCREHLRPRQSQGCRHVDAHDARVSIRRTDERRVEHIRQVDVLDVEALAEQKARILAPENPLAQDTTHTLESLTVDALPIAHVLWTLRRGTRPKPHAEPLPLPDRTAFRGSTRASTP